MPSSADWTAVINLIEEVMTEEDLLSSAVTSARTNVREIAALPAADIAGHTRGLLAAATRALADRRGPTDAELAFVAELAATRARQDVPIEAVLMAIHVASRVIWSRAREIAAIREIPPAALLDVRELYEDWAEAVRARLISEYHAVKLSQGTRAGDREAVLLRRLLAGGSTAVLAAAEAGLPAGGGLWLLTARAGEDAAVGRLQRALRTQRPMLLSFDGGFLVGVAARPPAPGLIGADTAVGIAGPGEPGGLAALRRLAIAALAAAELTGRRGLTHIAEVAVLAAVADRPDLSGALLERHAAARTALGAQLRPVATAVRAWLEADRDAALAGQRLFVHPNTVRNRVQRFTEVTGIDPAGTVGGLNAWWLCGGWLGGG
ncbi:helix-turn-helix domain-containing protein [Melissospora conviva]|uniref:helix-turn-helix domain-containing protein n=1 Tax=Melissospora conviva TaxID=3388432 RepID=UPI003B7F5D00